MAKDKIEAFDNQTGYTDDMFILQADIRRYTRFIATMIRLELMSVRNGQILSSNYGQRRFDQLKDDNFHYGPTNI